MGNSLSEDWKQRLQVPREISGGEYVTKTTKEKRRIAAANAEYYAKFPRKSSAEREKEARLEEQKREADRKYAESPKGREEKRWWDERHEFEKKEKDKKVYSLCEVLGCTCLFHPFGDYRHLRCYKIWAAYKGKLDAATSQEQKYAVITAYNKLKEELTNTEWGCPRKGGNSIVVAHNSCRGCDKCEPPETKTKTTTPTTYTTPYRSTHTQEVYDVHGIKHHVGSNTGHLQGWGDDWHS